MYLTNIHSYENSVIEDLKVDNLNSVKGYVNELETLTVDTEVANISTLNTGDIYTEEIYSNVINAENGNIENLNVSVVVVNETVVGSISITGPKPTINLVNGSSTSSIIGGSEDNMTISGTLNVNKVKASTNDGVVLESQNGSNSLSVTNSGTSVIGPLNATNGINIVDGSNSLIVSNTGTTVTGNMNVEQLNTDKMKAVTNIGAIIESQNGSNSLSVTNSGTSIIGSFNATGGGSIVSDSNSLSVTNSGTIITGILNTDKVKASTNDGLVLESQNGFNRVSIINSGTSITGPFNATNGGSITNGSNSLVVNNVGTTISGTLNTDKVKASTNDGVVLESLNGSNSLSVTNSGTSIVGSLNATSGPNSVSVNMVDGTVITGNVTLDSLYGNDVQLTGTLNTDKVKASTNDGVVLESLNGSNSLSVTNSGTSIIGSLNATNGGSIISGSNSLSVTNSGTSIIGPLIVDTINIDTLHSATTSGIVLESLNRSNSLSVTNSGTSITGSLNATSGSNSLVVNNIGTTISGTLITDKVKASTNDGALLESQNGSNSLSVTNLGTSITGSLNATSGSNSLVVNNVGTTISGTLITDKVKASTNDGVVLESQNGSNSLSVTNSGTSIVGSLNATSGGSIISGSNSLTINGIGTTVNGPLISEIIGVDTIAATAVEGLNLESENGLNSVSINNSNTSVIGPFSATNGASITSGSNSLVVNGIGTTVNGVFNTDKVKAASNLGLVLESQNGSNSLSVTNSGVSLGGSLNTDKVKASTNNGLVLESLNGSNSLSVTNSGVSLNNIDDGIGLDLKISESNTLVKGVSYGTNLYTYWGSESISPGINGSGTAYTLINMNGSSSSSSMIQHNRVEFNNGVFTFKPGKHKVTIKPKIRIRANTYVTRSFSLVLGFATFSGVNPINIRGLDFVSSNISGFLDENNDQDNLNGQIAVTQPFTFYIDVAGSENEDMMMFARFDAPRQSFTGVDPVGLINFDHHTLVYTNYTSTAQTFSSITSPKGAPTLIEIESFNIIPSTSSSYSIALTT